MRVAFCGASGTGKTTLAMALSEKRGWPFIEVGIRSWLKRNEVKSVRALGWRERARMQTEVLSDKMFCERMTPEFVTDRSSLDFAAYAIYTDSALNIYDYIHMALEHAIEFYDRMFLLPWDALPWCSDGVRFGRKEIEDWIVRMAPEEMLIRIESVGLEDRLNEVESYL